MSNIKSRLRIVKDLSDLEKENPEGIYIYINKVNFLKNYAMIVGPKNTPYFGGFFFFEITFPKNYPKNPPHIKFLTIDGKVRFNPNLYENGKVCLSILGTWSGPGWKPVMNLTSILLSIRSLMGEYPIQNEPGFDRIKPSDKISINYNYFIIYNTYKLAFISVLNSKFSNISKHFKKQIKLEAKKNYEEMKNDLLSYNISLKTIKFGKIIYFLPCGNILNFSKLLSDFEKLKV